MERMTAASKSTATECGTAATETAASATTKTAAATAAMLNLGRQSVGCEFR
jgi:hypothetical protein